VVEYVLVVTTVEDVWLLALCRGPHPADPWQAVPTSFVVASDAVRLTSIAGTDTGRIFLGGDDGCLYEMLYEDSTLGASDRLPTTVQDDLEAFYDGTKSLPSVVSAAGQSKRSWWQAALSVSSLPTSTSSSSTEPPRKCRKLNRSRPASPWSLSAAPSAPGGRISQLVVDEERQTLSLLTDTGMMQVYDLRQNSSRLVATAHLPSSTRLYLEAVARGQMVPPQPTRRNAAGLRFPGGGAAAQAGVGGMAGARAWLKATESANRSNNGARSGSSKASSLLQPTKLHVISCRESAHLTMMVVTTGGLRLYLSTLANHVLNTGAVEAVKTASLRRTTLSPLLPSRITLCHVRAPPPLAAQSVATPTTANFKVEASWHSHGQWLVALEEATHKGANRLLSVTPDVLARPKAEEDPKKKSELVHSGGLAETVGFVTEGNPPTLPGGLVWDICQLPSSTPQLDVLWELTSHSPTPVDAGEIPPAFYPPSKVHRADIGSGERRLAVAAPPSVRATALQITGQLFVNFMLSRPLSQGLTIPALANQAGHNGMHAGVTTNEYRVSRRTGTRGFSKTAEEVSSSRSSSMGTGSRQPTSGNRSSGTTRGSLSLSSTRNLAKSARLLSRVLQPSTISLNPLATQHLVGEAAQLVALNAQGIHFFSMDSTLSSLAETIMSAGENVGDDAAVTKFFSSYGYPEGCAMSLALGIGCGPASGMVGYAQDLRRRAKKAALTRAYVPRLVRSVQTTSTDGVAVDAADSTTDPFVPVGYEFRPSALCQGLVSLFSRLLRSIWNKPFVVVTEGRTVKLQWSQGTTITPAKVELLLDEKGLEGVRTPLQSLHTLIKDVFARAIVTVPGMEQRQGSRMDIDDGLGQSSAYLTQAMQYQSQLRAGNVGTTPQITPREAENIAHLIEERNIHSLFRLLSRVVQLLELVSLLQKADAMVELPEVDWGLLHGLTVAQLAQSVEGQDRLETLLNGLVVASAASKTSVSYSADADRMASSFATQCYLFFPPASRFAYHGIRLAMEALACQPTSARRRSLAAQAATNLCNAAKHWYSPSLISGRLLRARGNESAKEISIRATKYGSPLAKAAGLMVQLEDVASIVDMCLLTADNFRTRRSKVLSRDALPHDKALSWELELYHSNREAPPTTTDTSIPRVSDSYGTSVSGQDAIDTCYAIILHNLSLLLVSNRALADRMISACTASTDTDFLKELFKFLLEHNHADTLLRIDSSDVDTWLQEHKDPDLLWRYYNVQGKHIYSGKVSYDRAKSEETLSLDERIECLSRALNAYRAAAKEKRWEAVEMSSEELKRREVEVEDALTVARLQYRVLRAIESMPDFPSDISGDEIHLLKSSLLPLTTLFNDYAAKASLYEICLVIFHAARHDTAHDIVGLWKNLFSEQLHPCSTVNAKAFRFLEDLASETGHRDVVEFLSNDSTSSGKFPNFEQGGWIPKLEDKIVSLGRELYGKGADFTFPIEFLMDVMENLRKAEPSLLPPGWTLQTLADAGVPYLLLLEIFDTMSQRDERYRTGGPDNESVQDSLLARLDLFKYWVSSCHKAGDGQASSAQQELLRANATGEVPTLLNSLRSKIACTPGTTGLMENLTSIEEAISYLV
jgi:nuclear pore complex protein Nup155